MVDSNRSTVAAALEADARLAYNGEDDNWSQRSQTSELYMETSGVRLSALCLNMLQDISDAASHYSEDRSASLPRKKEPKKKAFADFFKIKKRRSKSKSKSERQEPFVSSNVPKNNTENPKAIEPKTLPFFNSKGKDEKRSKKDEKKDFANDSAKRPGKVQGRDENITPWEENARKTAPTSKENTLPRRDPNTGTTSLSRPLRILETGLQKMVTNINQKFPNSDEHQQEQKVTRRKKKERGAKARRDSGNYGAERYIEETGQQEYSAFVKFNNLPDVLNSSLRSARGDDDVSPQKQMSHALPPEMEVEPERQISPKLRDRQSRSKLISDRKHRGRSAELPSRSSTDDLIPGKRIRRRALSREWVVVKTTTTEDTTIIDPKSRRPKSMQLQPTYSVEKDVTPKTADQQDEEKTAGVYIITHPPTAFQLSSAFSKAKDPIAIGEDQQGNGNFGPKNFEDFSEELSIFTEKKDRFAIASDEQDMTDPTFFQQLSSFKQKDSFTLAIQQQNKVCEGTENVTDPIFFEQLSTFSKQNDPFTMTDEQQDINGCSWANAIIDPESLQLLPNFSNTRDPFAKIEDKTETEELGTEDTRQLTTGKSIGWQTPGGFKDLVTNNDGEVIKAQGFNRRPFDDTANFATPDAKDAPVRNWRETFASDVIQTKSGSLKDASECDRKKIPESVDLLTGLDFMEQSLPQEPLEHAHVGFPESSMFPGQEIYSTGHGLPMSFVCAVKPINNDTDHINDEKLIPAARISPTIFDNLERVKEKRYGNSEPIRLSTSNEWVVDDETFTPDKKRPRGFGDSQKVEDKLSLLKVKLADKGDQARVKPRWAKRNFGIRERSLPMGSDKGMTGQHALATITPHDNSQPMFFSDPFLEFDLLPPGEQIWNTDVSNSGPGKPRWTKRISNLRERRPTSVFAHTHFSGDDNPDKGERSCFSDPEIRSPTWFGETPTFLTEPSSPTQELYAAQSPPISSPESEHLPKFHDQKTVSALPKVSLRSSSEKLNEVMIGRKLMHHGEVNNDQKESQVSREDKHKRHKIFSPTRFTDNLQTLFGRSEIQTDDSVPILDRSFNRKKQLASGNTPASTFSKVWPEHDISAHSESDDNDRQLFRPVPFESKSVIPASNVRANDTKAETFVAEPSASNENDDVEVMINLNAPLLNYLYIEKCKNEMLRASSEAESVNTVNLDQKNIQDNSNQAQNIVDAWLLHSSQGESSSRYGEQQDTRITDIDQTRQVEPFHDNLATLHYEGNQPPLFTRHKHLSLLADTVAAKRRKLSDDGDNCQPIAGDEFAKDDTELTKFSPENSRQNDHQTAAVENDIEIEDSGKLTQEHTHDSDDRNRNKECPDLIPKERSQKENDKEQDRAEQSFSSPITWNSTGSRPLTPKGASTPVHLRDLTGCRRSLSDDTHSSLSSLYSPRRFHVDLPYSDSGFSEVETLSPRSIGSSISKAETVTEEDEGNRFTFQILDSITGDEDDRIFSGFPGFKLTGNGWEGDQSRMKMPKSAACIDNDSRLAKSIESLSSMISTEADSFSEKSEVPTIGVTEMKTDLIPSPNETAKQKYNPESATLNIKAIEAPSQTKNDKPIEATYISKEVKNVPTATDNVPNKYQNEEHPRTFGSNNKAKEDRIPTFLHISAETKNKLAPNQHAISTSARDEITPKGTDISNKPRNELSRKDSSFTNTVKNERTPSTLESASGSKIDLASITLGSVSETTSVSKSDIASTTLNIYSEDKRKVPPTTLKNFIGAETTPDRSTGSIKGFSGEVASEATPITMDCCTASTKAVSGELKSEASPTNMDSSNGSVKGFSDEIKSEMTPTTLHYCTGSTKGISGEVRSEATPTNMDSSNESIKGFSGEVKSESTLTTTDRSTASTKGVFGELKNEATPTTMDSLTGFVKGFSGDIKNEVTPTTLHNCTGSTNGISGEVKFEATSTNMDIFNGSVKGFSGEVKSESTPTTPDRSTESTKGVVGELKSEITPTTLHYCTGSTKGISGEVKSEATPTIMDNSNAFVKGFSDEVKGEATPTAVDLSTGSKSEVTSTTLHLSSKTKSEVTPISLDSSNEVTTCFFSEAKSDVARDSSSEISTSFFIGTTSKQAPTILEDSCEAMNEVTSLILDSCSGSFIEVKREVKPTTMDHSSSAKSEIAQTTLYHSSGAIKSLSSEIKNEVTSSTLNACSGVKSEVTPIIFGSSSEATRDFSSGGKNDSSAISNSSSELNYGALRGIQDPMVDVKGKFSNENTTDVLPLKQEQYQFGYKTDNQNHTRCDNNFTVMNVELEYREAFKNEKGSSHESKRTDAAAREETAVPETTFNKIEAFSTGNEGATKEVFSKKNGHGEKVNNRFQDTVSLTPVETETHQNDSSELDADRMKATIFVATTHDDAGLDCSHYGSVNNNLLENVSTDKNDIQALESHDFEFVISRRNLTTCCDGTSQKDTEQFDEMNEHYDATVRNTSKNLAESVNEKSQIEKNYGVPVEMKQITEKETTKEAYNEAIQRPASVTEKAEHKPLTWYEFAEQTSIFRQFPEENKMPVFIDGKIDKSLLPSTWVWNGSRYTNSYPTLAKRDKVFHHKGTSLSKSYSCPLPLDKFVLVKENRHEIRSKSLSQKDADSRKISSKLVSGQRKLFKFTEKPSTPNNESNPVQDVVDQKSIKDKVLNSGSVNPFSVPNQSQNDSQDIRPKQNLTKETRLASHNVTLNNNTATKDEAGQNPDNDQLPVPEVPENSLQLTGVTSSQTESLPSDTTRLPSRPEEDNNGETKNSNVTRLLASSAGLLSAVLVLFFAFQLNYINS